MYTLENIDAWDCSYCNCHSRAQKKCAFGVVLTSAFQVFYMLPWPMRTQYFFLFVFLVIKGHVKPRLLRFFTNRLIVLFRLFGLRLKVPVNNFSVMLEWFPGFNHY